MKILIEQGGIVIYPLLTLSVITLAIIIERFFYFIRIRKNIPDKLMSKIKNNLQYANSMDEISFLKDSPNPICHVLYSGIAAWRENSLKIERAMEETKLIEFPKMEKRLTMLHFIAKISPSLGLLGTVTGMIKTFHFLSLDIEPQLLAQGISEALITTAFGLSLSIPAFAAYYYFMNKIENLIKHAEKRELELINYIQKLGSKDAQIQA